MMPLRLFYTLIATDGPWTTKPLVGQEPNRGRPDYYWGFAGGLFRYQVLNAKGSPGARFTVAPFLNPRRMRWLLKYRGKAEIPGPPIRMSVEDELVITLVNLGVSRPELSLGELPYLHVHRSGLNTTFEDGGEGLPSYPVGTISNLSSVTYKLKFKVPGTYYYHCHDKTYLHHHMGMFGAIVVYPSRKPLALEEDLVLVSEFDSTLAGRLGKGDVRFNADCLLVNGAMVSETSTEAFRLLLPSKPATRLWRVLNLTDHTLSLRLDPQVAAFSRYDGELTDMKTQPDSFELSVPPCCSREVLAIKQSAPRDKPRLSLQRRSTWLEQIRTTAVLEKSPDGASAWRIFVSQGEPDDSGGRGPSRGSMIERLVSRMRKGLKKLSNGFASLTRSFWEPDSQARWDCSDGIDVNVFDMNDKEVVAKITKAVNEAVSNANLRRPRRRRSPGLVLYLIFAKHLKGGEFVEAGSVTEQEGV